MTCRRVWLWALVLVACARPLPVSPPPAEDQPPVVALREWFEEAPEFGGELYALEAGPAAGPPLVMVHGLGGGASRDFAPLLPILSQHFRILTFDLPGLGRSTHHADDYSPQRYAAFVSKMIARHFARPVAVLGHSMGAAIALELAGDHPEQVERLMLLDVSGVLHYRQYMREIIRGSREEQSVGKRIWSGLRSALFAIGMWSTKSMDLKSLALDANSTFRNFFTSSRTAALLFVRHDFGPAIRRVQAPTFLGWGKRDAVAPLRTSTLLRAALPLRRFHLFHNSAHVPMRSEPVEVAEALRAFMEEQFEPPVETRYVTGRNGVCEKHAARLFEGDFDTITIHRCRGVVLRNVRARNVVIDRSEVVMEDVAVDHYDVALRVRESRVRWSGGKIRGDTCIAIDASAVELAGVRCTYRSSSVEVYRPSRLLSSASVLTKDELDTPLHGEYELFRTRLGKLTELVPRPEGRYTENSRTLLERDDLARRWLEGEDMAGASLQGVNLAGARLGRAVLEHTDLRDANLEATRLDRADLRHADLRGARLSMADLHHADLRGADLRETDLHNARLTGARYDASTKFPRGFVPAPDMQRDDAEVPAP